MEWKRLVVWLGALAVSWGALAASPTLTNEITFTRADLQEGKHGPGGEMPMSDENLAALEEYYYAALAAFERRRDVESVEWLEGERSPDKWGNPIVRVTYRDGWYFDVTLDPYCLEVLPRYYTLEDLKNKYADRIQTDIFDLMESLDLKPDRISGGGHVHMGAELAFGRDGVLFRNWLVDQANHSELATGALERDYTNAMPFIKLTRNQREEFRRLIARFDRGDIRGRNPVRQLASEFVAKVIFEGKAATGNRIMMAKYWQANVLRMAYIDNWDTVWSKAPERWTWKEYESVVLFDDVPVHARTAEIRPLKAQNNVDEMIADDELIVGRLEYLRRLTRQGRRLQLSDDFMAGKLPQPAVGAHMFYDFVTEAGCHPADYLSRLPRNRGEGGREWRLWSEAYRRLLGNTCPRDVEKAARGKRGRKRGG